MLRIGDIHITSKQADTILDELRVFVNKHPDEQHIVFFGDYVYHFQYDRKSLLQLFHFFLDLYRAGKYVYVLAGNHDRLHNHFVYEEAQHVFAETSQKEGGVQFITEPTLLTIEEQDCLFFPYTPFLSYESTNETQDGFEHLLNSEHAGEQLSGKANALLAEYIVGRRETNTSMHPLCVFHHRYIAETTFPGQKTKFVYKHHALSPAFAEMEDVLLVSGHIHHPFVWENYICVGSVRSTSPLEINQTKFLFRRNVEQQELHAQPLEINPYVRVSTEKITHLTEAHLLQERQMMYEASCQYLSSGSISVVCDALDAVYPRAKTTCSIEHATLGYDEIIEYVDPIIYEQTKKIVLKRDKKKYSVSAEELDIASDTLDTSIANRKQLLERYITKKRKEDAHIYLDLLQELKIL